MKRILLLIVLLSIGSTFSFAQAPDLGRQDAWGSSEKKTFLKFLQSNQQMPVTGQVKDVAAPKGGLGTAHKARYLTLNLVADTMFPVASDGKVSSNPTALGGKLLAGGHLFSWVRYYGGLQYSPMRQKRLAGTKASLSHWQVPAGIELALIPLGTPHTRYVLLRGGVAAHYVTGGNKGDFKTPLTGLRYSWNLGLGYEWQIEDSNWRVNTLVEGYKSLAKKDGSRFYGLSFTLGLVRTF